MHPLQGPLAGLPRWQKRLLSTVVLAAAFVGAVAVEIHLHGTYFFVSCNIDDLQPHGVGRASYLYSADGVRFATLGAAVDKQPVPLSKIDPKLVQATIAVEDRRFYHEGGTDWVGVLRAAVADVTSANLGQGAPPSPSSSSATSTSVRNGRSAASSRKAASPTSSPSAGASGASSTPTSTPSSTDRRPTAYRPPR